MKIDWTSQENHLLLNPRMSEDLRARYERAWETYVEGRLAGHVGIATSGTSGEHGGRLILLSKSALQASARGANAHLQATASDVWMKTLPDFHVGGLSIYVRSFLNGARVYQSKLGKWDAAAFYQELVESRATLLSLVPTQLFDLAQLGFHAPPSLRAIVVGGGRLERELHRKALQLGWPALASYGMTECGSQVATARLQSLALLLADVEGEGARIVPLPHVQLRSNQGQDSVGPLELKSEGLLTAQIRFTSSEALYEDPKVDGWFRTEDLGEVRVDGSLVIHGRTKDFVKIGGEGVVLSRLEERLEKLKLTLAFPYDAAVLAAHDDRLGAKIVLFTEASDEDSRSFIEAFNSEVMPFERIRETHQLRPLPRSALGKLLRAEAFARAGLTPPHER